MNDNIVLVGMPGSGKSAVGRVLAKRLRRTLVETDAETENAAGMSIADVFAAHGEAHFRELETTVLTRALSESAQVVSTGGGIVLSAENRALMRKSAWVAYLSAPVSLLCGRLKADSAARPLLPEISADAVEELLRQREKLYQQTAHVAVAQHAKDTPADVAEKTCAGLRCFMPL